jgi:hypothetical protein
LGYVRGLLLSVVLILAATGCGGGSDGTATRVATMVDQRAPSKPDYIEVADVVCMNHRSRRDDLESQAGELGPLNSPSKADEVADLLRKEGRNLRSELAELEARRPPAAELPLSAFLTLTRARAEAIDEWADAYDDLDEARIRQLQARVGALAAAAELRARKYGFHVCGG